MIVRLRNYLHYFSRIPELCDGLKNDTLNVYFAYVNAIAPSNPNYFFPYTPRYQQTFQPIKRIIEICDLLGINGLESNKSLLENHVGILGTCEACTQKKAFIESINFIKETFDMVNEEIKYKISLLNTTEIDRLNEAIHNNFEDCNYSTVAMSVCAIEFRLLSLMKSVRPDKEEELKKLTLGQLVNEYLKNKDYYQRIIPERHESLLNFCNRYRVSAVHPKEEEITKRISHSILNLSFEFLLDESMKAK